MNTSSPVTASAATTRSLKWRVVDITVASVIGVASSLIYWLAALAYGPISVLDSFIPGLWGVINGLWLFAAPLALIIVRKPGAAIYAEVVAAILESLLGNSWGGTATFLTGLVQGIAAEVVFLAVAYKVWNLWITVLSGTVAGLACWGYTFFTNLQAIDWNGPYGAMNLITTLISGAVFAGFFVWWLYLGIAQTGALDHFESGRDVRAKATGATRERA
ncbi:ECF transporter S component [Alloscardovia macacae]|uniref:ABC transporter permease n=1 Tax=Alloscardovia macacae TaxID=1160091 RepID=A0A261F3B4_9BIFI|nr:ECF transporter S component [Alloscardovia macacae]OZG53604.1 ABC transporter permease [Alloscardovia macacae]